MLSEVPRTMDNLALAVGRKELRDPKVRCYNRYWESDVLSISWLSCEVIMQTKEPC